MISISMENALAEEYFTMILVSFEFRPFQNKVVSVSKRHKIDAYLIWPRVSPFRLIGEFQSGFLHLFKDDSDVGDIVMLVAL